MSMLLVVFLSALVMAHVALPEMRRGNTLFVRDGEKEQSGRAARMASKLRVPIGWSEPQPGPRHAR